jgi:hypothetical protein
LRTSFVRSLAVLRAASAAGMSAYI